MQRNLRALCVWDSGVGIPAEQGVLIQPAWLLYSISKRIFTKQSSFHFWVNHVCNNISVIVMCPPDRPIKCATYHVPRISYLMPRALHLVLRTTYHAPRTSYITHHIPFIVKLTSPSLKPPLPQSYLGSRVGRAISNNILVLSVCIIWKALCLILGVVC
jgi:hypothetical protein